MNVTLDDLERVVLPFLEKVGKRGNPVEVCRYGLEYHELAETTGKTFPELEEE